MSWHGLNFLLSWVVYACSIVLQVTLSLIDCFDSLTIVGKTTVKTDTQVFICVSREEMSPWLPGADAARTHGGEFNENI